MRSEEKLLIAVILVLVNFLPALISRERGMRISSLLNVSFEHIFIEKKSAEKK